LPFFQISPGLDIHYLDQYPEGSPIVLLLHGLGSCGESWGYQFPALGEAGFRAIAPDFPGFGNSNYPGGGTSIAAIAGSLVQLLRSLGAEPAHVVGISMGGTVALQMALDAPNWVKKLILVNTFAQLRPKSASVWTYFAVRYLLVHTLGLPAQAKAVAGRIFPQPQQDDLRRELVRQICQADPRGYRAAMRALARFNVRQRLREIRCDTLVVSGEFDSTVPLETQQQLVQGIPGARHITIRSAGHAVIAEQPDVFNRCLLDFLNGN
jgi:pimeloyl-ACP methyl ester carboxylesterase